MSFQPELRKNLFRSILLLITWLSSFPLQADDFPMGPDRRLTPGQLCQQSPKRRYRENILYCERDVSREQKLQVMREYDQQLGFITAKLPREDFKLDHLIPLCLGGSNDALNLWPQHKTVFVNTDPIEQIACDLLRDGGLKQNEAIDFVLDAKHDAHRASEILTELKTLLRSRHSQDSQAWH